MLEELDRTVIEKGYWNRSLAIGEMVRDQSQVTRRKLLGKRLAGAKVFRG